MQESSLFFFFKTTKKKKSKSYKRKAISKSSPNLFKVDTKNNSYQTRSSTNLATLAIKTDLSTPSTRTVFLDLFSLHKCWRIISSDILCDSIIILPNIHTEWILKPTKYNNIPSNISKILSDDVFVALLQWKYQQRLLFCMLNPTEVISKCNAHTNKDVSPFWHYFSGILSELNDPFTSKNRNYKPLIFNFKFYENKLLYQSKFGVTSLEIISELMGTKTKQTANVICEMLYQSNPSLNIINSYSDIINTITNPQKNKNYVNTRASPDSPMSPMSPISPLENGGCDINTLLDDIMESLPPDDEPKNEEHCELNFEADSEWWFAEDYENYDGFQEIKYTD